MTVSQSERAATTVFSFMKGLISVRRKSHFLSACNQLMYYRWGSKPAHRVNKSGTCLIEAQQ